ncbi:MAG: RNA polymerase sigma factor, partial [Saprospiraceae bacterium]
SGDRKAQFRLYKLYSKAMFNTCLRMMKNREDAEDVLQNSFVDVFTKMHLYREEATIGSWIKRIVINNCINQLKKKKILISDWEQERIEQVPDQKGTEIQLPYTVQNIKQTLKELPTGYRIVFSLYALEGYDHKEIAEILGTSLSTSKSQYSRAKKRIREILLRDNIDTNTQGQEDVREVHREK